MAASAPVSHPGALPIVRTRLFGRDEEIAAGRSLLLDEAVPLLTVTGPGGVGKTRLILAIAQHAADAFADGPAWVDLAPLADPALVPETVAAALGVVPTPDRPVSESLARQLRPRQMLLVLDNCEHLLGATAQLVSALLAACPALQVLASSRAPLRVLGEQVLPLDPLPLPLRNLLPVSDLERNPALRLLLARARAVPPSFALTEANAPTMAGICRRLDGLPLAIELAAARMAMLSPEALLAQVSERLTLLSGGPRDAPARQQTIGAAIAWSYDLLAAEDRATLRRLGVFAGGWSIDAAATVTGLEIAEVMPALTRLAEQSLIRPAEGSAEPRFTMLETIREFALARLAEHDEDPTRDRHASYFQDLAARAEPDLFLGRVSAGWFTRLDVERDNIRAALAWMVERGMTERALLTSGALAEYWAFRSEFREGREWCERSLALTADQTSTPACIGALYGVGILASFQGDADRGMICAQAMLCAAEACGEQIDIVRAHFAICFVARRQRDFAVATEAKRSALALARQIGASGWVAWTLVQLGEILSSSAAQAEAEEALALFRELRSEWGQVNALLNLAVAATKRGDVAQAARYYLESLAIRDAIDDRWGTVDDLVGTAEIAAARGYLREAALLLGAAYARAEALDYGDVGRNAGRPTTVERHLRRELDPELFAASRGQGAGMAPREAVDLARELLTRLADGVDGNAPPMNRGRRLIVAAPTRTSSSGAALAPGATRADFHLTRREREVLGLLCRRLTDAEIAEHLFISPATASTHVGNILAKLGVSNRRQAAAFAARHSLV